MTKLTINKQEAMLMKLLHYFITNQKYDPVVLKGIDGEIWLQNLNGDYKMIRLVSKYIHNNEQLEENLFITKRITSNIRLKTFTWKLPVLSIYLNLGENVTELEENCIRVDKPTDLKNNDLIKSNYPDLYPNLKISDDKGIDLLNKITGDINQVTENNNQRMNDVFSDKFPIVTYTLMGLCIAMFIVLSMFGGSTNSATLVFFGANVGELIRVGEYWRLVTSAFLHIGIIHLAFNMYILFLIGPKLESYYGKARFITIYLGSAIGCSLLSIIFTNGISAGASGAIFGLLGAFCYFGYHHRIYLGDTIKRQIVPLILLNLAIGFMIPGIDNAGHIGGLIAGILLSMAVGVKYKTKANESTHGIILSLIYFGFLIYYALIR